jgi:hypothetical protein
MGIHWTVLEDCLVLVMQHCMCSMLR